MKSTVSNKPCSEEKPFPKLMKSRRTNVIYLCLVRNKGTIVGNPSLHQPLGKIVEISCPEYLVDFSGSVCLENGD